MSSVCDEIMIFEHGNESGSDIEVDVDELF